MVERDDYTEQLGTHVESFCDELAALKREVINDPAYWDEDPQEYSEEEAAVESGVEATLI